MSPGESETITGTALHLPARDIPVPTSVSAQAQAIIAMGPMRAPLDYPPLDAHAAWRALAASGDEKTMTMIAPRVARADVETVRTDDAGVPIYVITPRGTAPTDHRVYLDIHGGGLIQGGGDLCRAFGISTSVRVRARVWSVDYRMPPDHPYPDPLNDCLAAYRFLLQHHDPEDIIVGGPSAGGNLAAALILRARDEGLPLPAAAFLATPQADLTESGDSFQTNLGLDPLLRRSLMPANLLYANGHDLTDPYLSPLFADFTKGFPPTLITTGTRDLFLSNAVLLHRALRAADIHADLHIVEGGGHGGYLGTAPEDAAIDTELHKFLDTHWAKSATK